MAHDHAGPEPHGDPEEDQQDDDEGVIAFLLSESLIQSQPQFVIAGLGLHS